MDMQTICVRQEGQDASLTSVHIQESYALDIAGTVASPPWPSEYLSVWSFPSHIFLVLGNSLFEILKITSNPFDWFFRKLLLYVVTVFIIILFFFLTVATLGSVTFLFLLASLIAVRFCQLIKRGEEYDKVTQVKAIIEWFLFSNVLCLSLIIWLVCVFTDMFLSSKLDTRILGGSLFYWGNLVSVNIILVFGIRLVLFGIIQKHMPRMTLERNESGLNVIEATSDIVDCLLVLYIGSMIMDYFPNHQVLGYPTQKWTPIMIYIVIGWNIIALSTHLIVWSIHRLVAWYLYHVNDRERSHRYLLLERLLNVQCLVYYGNGIKRSLNFVLRSLLLFLVWISYFGPHLKKTDSYAKIVLHFGTRTFTILLILSVLWVIKDFVLLSWEANAVYNRLSSKLLEARKSLYFLGMLGRRSHDILEVRYEVPRTGSQHNNDESTKSRAEKFLAKNLARVDAYYRDKRDEDDDDDNDNEIEKIEKNSQLKPKLSNKKRTRAKHDLLLLQSDTMTLFDIQQVAQYFLSAANALLKETYTSDILRQMNSPGVNREILEKLLTGKTNAADVAESSSQSALKDWKYFEDLLDLNSSVDISHIKVKTWVEKSHNKCLFLANTLRSAKEVVACLNTIISTFLISASLILWLILTGLANTSALVLIASPLLAATFIFGDTCKSLFQGIIFIYVVHPFDVGDLCVIDGKMMEVKAIGVWKTTFSNIDRVCTPEEVIYPNSDIALKMFVNHKTEFDWKDYVEVNVEQLEEQQIKELKKQIEDLLDAERDESMPSSYSVTVISADKDIKVAVHFRHKKPDADMTYCECLKEKDNLRSAFILDIQRLVSKEIDNKN